MIGAYRDGSPGTLSDLRSASVNNTRLASVAVLHQIHTFVRHCSSPLFHDIGLFVEQLQQAVSDQEKKILEQQKVLREQQQRQAEAASAATGNKGSDVTMTDGQEGDDVSMTGDQTCRKQKASDKDLNDSLAKRTKSSSSDSLARLNSSSPLGELGAKQPSDDPTQLESGQPAPANQAQPTQLESAQFEPGTQAEAAQTKSAQAEPLTQPDQPAQQNAQAQDEFHLLDDSIQRTLAQMTDEPDAAAGDSTQQADGNHMGDEAHLKPAESDLAAAPADCIPVEPGTQPVEAPAVATSPAEGDSGEGGPAEGLPADPIGTTKDVGRGVEHPLGGPKPDKPKRRKKFTKDSVRVCASSLHASLYNTLSCAAFPLPYTCYVESF